MLAASLWEGEGGGGGVRHILTFLTKYKKQAELAKYLVFFFEYDTL